MLIEAGANPNSRAGDSSTPLCIVALNGHADAIKVLLQAKADPLLPYIFESVFEPAGGEPRASRRGDDQKGT